MKKKQYPVGVTSYKHKPPEERTKIERDLVVAYRRGYVAGYLVGHRRKWANIAKGNE